MAQWDLLHYRIVDELGSGAMGQVYRAIDQKLGRHVALKLLPASVAGDAGWEARMLREARAASQLNHPGIVTLHDIEHAEGRTFLVMELVQGDRLSDLASRGMPWEKAVEITAKIADALRVAHTLGIPHRDIKSDNLMVTRSGQPKVLDFGLAKLRDQGLPPVAVVLPTRPTPLPFASEQTVPAPLGSRPGASDPAHDATAIPASHPDNIDSGVTQAGQLVGTPSYMAPECFEGKADARSEVFSLGVVLYEVLVGRRPFEGSTTTAVMAAIQLDEPKPPSVAAPERKIPAAVDAVVARALAKDPAARFAEMAELRTALLATLVAAPPPAPARRRWPLVALGGAGIAAVATITILAVRGGGERPKEEPSIAIQVRGSRRLTLDTGCEEYPKLHPDGRHVIYDADVDQDYEIVMRDLQTGEVRRLTNMPGWDYAPALSPDGRRVAFIHEDPATRTLRVLDIDDPKTPPRDLGASVGYPSWTASGELLVGDVNGRILRRDLATGRETELGHLPAGARLYHLVEIPGKGLAVEWWTSSDTDATSLGELDPDATLRVVEETATQYEGGLAPASRTAGYYSSRRGATEANELVFHRWGGGPPIQIPGGLSAGAGIDVSRDGKRLVLSTCKDKSHIARLAAGKTPEPIASGAWQDTTPHVAGNYLYVTSDRLGPMQGWRIDLAGKEPARAVTPDRALGAAPSPDGRRIAYSADGGRGGLAVVEVDGGPARSLTNDPSDSGPVFTHDGKHVLFERTVSGVTAIYAVPVAGGPAVRIVEGAHPGPSPIDDRIVFVTSADASGARRILVTDLAGSPPVPVPNLEAAGWQRPVFSADAKRLLVIRGFQQVVVVALDGRTPAETVWSGTTTAVSVVEWGPGDEVIAALASYDGDLWLAEGDFP